MNTTLEHKVLEHVIKHQQKYLTLLAAIVLLTTLLTNVWLGNPLIKGGESYYHLSHAKTLTWSNPYYLPLWLAFHFLPEKIIVFIPILLAFISLLFFFHLARRLNISPRFTLFFLTLFIISPTFIWNYTTFSSFSAYLLLLLIGFLLFIHPKQWIHYLSLLPFLAATFFDIFSTLLLLAALFLYVFLYHQKKYSLFPFILILVSLAANIFFLQQPFVLGPFQVQESLPGLIADFGGMAGISFFLFLLALIGLGTRWRDFSAIALFIILLVPIYLYRTPAISFLAILVIIFAAFGVMFLLDREWVLKKLKTFTFLLLALGLLFSTISYLGRIDASSPTAGDVLALRWMNENLPKDAIIFSAADNGYFIDYFAQRQPFSRLHQQTLAGNISMDPSEDQKAIMDSVYIDQLFPLLEQNNIKYIYINPALRERLPANYGLLFLFKNERFKLLYSQEQYEVWSFEEPRLPELKATRGHR